MNQTATGTPTQWTHPDGQVFIEELSNDQRRVRVQPNDPQCFVARNHWTTRYPLSLIRAILDVKGLSHLCDEMMREEDPAYVAHHMQYDVLSYVEPSAFAGKRVLDFGCGSGASTMVLSREIPGAELVGIELEKKLLNVARLRADHYGLKNVQFIHSPDGSVVPSHLGSFDFIIFSAVFEHLFPQERKTLLPLLWNRLRSGGVLFLNQTPYRYSLIESHTTDLPLINYLPDSLALWAGRHFSKRVSPTQTWEELLRGGIRGGSVGEVMGILSKEKEKPTLLTPHRHGMQDRIDLWLMASTPRWRTAKRALRAVLKAFKLVTGIQLTPSLSLAIRKS